MRIVVKAPNWLGDAVMGLPALRSLRAMRPGARIAVLTKRGLADLYRCVTGADEVLPYDTWLGAVRAVRGRFDVALLLPRSFSSALLAFTARIPRRIGYAGEGRSALLTDRVPRDPDLLRRHRVYYYHRLLSRLGTPPDPEPPRLEVPEDARSWADERLPRGPLVAVNPGATYGAAKQWLPERFAEVGRRIAARARVVIVGGPAEAALGARIAAEIPGAIDLSGRTSVSQLAAALARCRLFVTNDTGPMHVADALGVPVVAIFGPTDPVTTPPFGRGHAIIRKELECSPCLKRTCPLGHHRCMKSIATDEVWEACRERLDR
ncbi:MAG: lipopolysaccharide heptosyltransferase II [Planctomycetes bacterium]|nr:lipopolysaccharide heptosyltransferase II [Planctomycetota bacterium]